MRKILVLLFFTAQVMSCLGVDSQPLIVDFHDVNKTGTPVEITIDYGIASIETVEEWLEADETLELERNRL